MSRQYPASGTTVGRIAGGTLAGRAGASVLLGLKLGALLAVCYGLVFVWHVHLLGFAAGLSSLVLGVMLGAARSHEPHGGAVAPEES